MQTKSRFRLVRHRLRNYDLVTYYKFDKVPCFTVELLQEMRDFAHLLLDSDFRWQGAPISRLIIKSAFPRFFNLGGDLNYFLEMIGSGNQRRLMSYAHLCLDCLELCRLVSQEIITISYLEGDCLGGGLESALAGQYVLAKNSKLRVGFPEARFGLFPGMGGHAICREIFGSEEEAERRVQDGKIYNAQEALNIGFLDGIESSVPAELPFKRKPPFDRAYLDEKAELWVEQALRLDKRDLGRIRGLVQKQNSAKLRVLAGTLKPLLSYRYVFGL